MNRAGIVSRAQLASARRYVVVLVVAVSAVVTPPDPGSQLILAIPLLLLFEGSLALMRITERQRSVESEEEPDSAGQET